MGVWRSQKPGGIHRDNYREHRQKTRNTDRNETEGETERVILKELNENRHLKLKLRQ